MCRAETAGSGLDAGIDEHLTWNGDVGHARGAVDRVAIEVAAVGDHWSKRQTAPRLRRVSWSHFLEQSEGDCACALGVDRREHHFVADQFDDAAAVVGYEIAGVGFEREHKSQQLL